MDLPILDISYKCSHKICGILSDNLFQLACFQSSSLLYHVLGLHSFLCLNNIAWMNILHQLMDILSCFHLLAIGNIHTYFQFSWVYT